MTSRFDSAVGLQPTTQTTEVKQPAVKASRFDTAIDRTPEPPPQPGFFDKLLTGAENVIKPVVQKVKDVVSPPVKTGPLVANFGEGLTPVQRANADTIIKNSSKSAEFESAVTKQRQQEQLKGVGTVATIASLPLIGPELAAKPVATLLQAGLFSGIDYVANKLNLHASNLAPEDASDKTKLALDVLQMVGEGFLAHGIYKKAPAVADAFTKNVVSTYKLPQQYTIPAATVKDIFQTGTKASPKDLEMFAKITGGDRAKINHAIQNGLDVTVPAEGVTKLVDKPYWAKIKSTLKVGSSEPKIINNTQYGEVAQAPKALIGESSSYVPPAPPPQGLITTPNRVALPGIPTPLSLEAKNPVAPGTPTQGQGFTMLDKATKPQVATAKLYADYNAAVKSFTANPTPTKLKQVQDLRAQVRAVTPVTPIAPSVVPTAVSPQTITPAPVTAPTVVPAPVQPAIVPTKVPGLPIPAPKVAAPIIQPTEGTISKAASDINKTLVSKGLEELPPEQLAKFDSITKKATIDKVSGIMADPVSAKAQLFNEHSKLTGPEKQVLFNAVKNSATKNGDYQTLIDLANHPIATERSQAAQTLGSSGFNNGGEDPVKTIQDIQKSRQNNFEKKTKKTVKEVSNSLDEEIKKSKPKKEDWKSFIQSIKCK